MTPQFHGGISQPDIAFRSADGEADVWGESDGVLALDELPEVFAEEETVQEIAEQTAYGAMLLDDLIGRQLTLSLSVGAIFLVALLGQPLLNRFAPGLVTRQVFGLPLHWLALAVLIYPLLWLLGAYFVATAKKYEDDFADFVRR